MDDVLGYEGSRVVVTGAASGMGEQAAMILADLGAEVIALDVQPVSAPVKESIHADLVDRRSIDDAIAAIGAPVHAVFSCAGLPGPPFTDMQVMTVNFIGARHLVEGLLGQMPPGAAVACIASAAGLGWQQQVETFAPLLATTDVRRRRRLARGAPRGHAVGRLRVLEGRAQPVGRVTQLSTS